MLIKFFSIDGHEFTLEFKDDQLQAGASASFEVNYSPKTAQLDYKTDEILDSYERELLNQITEVMNADPQLYGKFKKPRGFNRRGWTGGKNNIGERITQTARRTVLLNLIED
jgi:hypothetical protein